MLAYSAQLSIFFELKNFEALVGLKPGERVQL